MVSLQKDAERDAEIALKRAKATERYRQQRASKDTQGETKTANDMSDNQMISNDENQNQNQNQNQSQNQNQNQKQIYKPKKKERKEKDIEKGFLFERFWTAYPRKVAKQTAMRAFEKIDPDEAMLETMIAAVGKWKMTDQWNEAGGQFIPHPATWLNQRRWEDELPKPGKTKPTVIAQMYEQRDYSGVQEELMAMQDQEMADFLKN